MMHRLAHWLGWQFGHVVSAYDKHGTLWLGFRCAKCGKVTNIAANHWDMPKPEEFRP